LALFHFGPAFKANLLVSSFRKDADALSGTAAGAGAASEAGVSILGRQLEIATAGYVKEARAALGDARKSSEALNTTLREAAKKAASAEAAKHIDKDELFKKLDGDGSKDGDLPADKVVEALGGALDAQLAYFKSTRDAAATALKEAGSDPATNKPYGDEANAIAGAMHKAVNESISAPIARVEAAGARLEQRLLFIDEVAGAGVAPPKAAAPAAAIPVGAPN
ncbi:MAG TPA: hypothetical protein VEB41_15585, partial [Burkholderiales bacterium]|nr:hypothetical protein [Burkholderiales bacterium]